MLWSAHRLPVLTGSMDCVLMDLPFSKLAANIPKHYRPKPPAVSLLFTTFISNIFLTLRLMVVFVLQFIEEVARVSRPGTARIVLLVQSHQQVISCMDSIYFHDTHILPVNISGYIGCLITSRRTEVTFKPIIRQRAGRDQGSEQPETNLGKRPYAFVDSL